MAHLWAAHFSGGLKVRQEEELGVGAEKLPQQAWGSQAARKRKRGRLYRKLFIHVFSLLTRSARGHTLHGLQ